MEDHYTAVVLKNTSAPRLPQQQRGRRPTSPRKKKGGASSRSRGKGASSKSRSKSPRKGRKKKGGGGGRKRSGRRGGGAGGAGAGEGTAASGKVYTSAGAFMAEHFPSEEKQVRWATPARGKRLGVLRGTAATALVKRRSTKGGGRGPSMTPTLLYGLLTRPVCHSMYIRPVYSTKFDLVPTFFGYHLHQVFADSTLSFLLGPHTYLLPGEGCEPARDGARGRVSQCIRGPVQVCSKREGAA